MSSRPEISNASSRFFAAKAMDRTTLGEEAFHRMISIERRRTTRSRKSFLLMLLDMGEHATSKNHQLSLRKMLSILSLILRETDVTGWYKEDSVVGVMFTEITLDDQSSVPATLMTRVTEMLKEHLSTQQFRQIGISFHLVPEPFDREGSAQNAPLAPYEVVSAVSSTTETSL